MTRPKPRSREPPTEVGQSARVLRRERESVRRYMKSESVQRELFFYRQRLPNEPASRQWFRARMESTAAAPLIFLLDALLPEDLLAGGLHPLNCEKGKA